MATWADAPNNLANSTNSGVVLASTKVNFASTTTYEVALTITSSGSPGVTCTRTDTGTYALSFPTAPDQHITIERGALSASTLEDVRIISVDLTAGTAAFETFVTDAGTARLDDPNLTSADLVVKFNVFTLGTSA